MLFKKSDRLAINGIILTSLLTLLSGCLNGAALEDLVGAAPELKQKAEEVSLRTQNPVVVSQIKQAPSTNNPNRNGVVQQNSGNNSLGQGKLSLPETFPVYPQAKLLESKSSEGDSPGKMLWKIQDNRQVIADYYLTELASNNWDIIQPFNINPQQKIARAIAVKDNLKVELSLLESSKNQGSPEANTSLSVAYQSLNQDIASGSNLGEQNAPEGDKSFSPKVRNPQTAQQSGNHQGQANPQSKSSALNQNSYISAANGFADLDEVPPQLQQPIESVAALDILTPYTGKGNVDLTKFAPNAIITRGEYARWLMAANNRYYADNPSKKIYLATKTSQPAFNDVNPNYPDFEAIQSLAEAGLIPSRLTEDSTNLLFRPDTPLTRADLLTWKIPLDTRKSLPKASIQAIEDSWGFQDAADIDSSATRALYADFQNGDRSNVRRMFGYTTLFQPKKAVTRAEAAASLWYFGFQGDGITAKEVLKSAAGMKG